MKNLLLYILFKKVLEQPGKNHDMCAIFIDSGNFQRLLSDSS